MVYPENINLHPVRSCGSESADAPVQVHISMFSRSLLHYHVPLINDLVSGLRPDLNCVPTVLQADPLTTCPVPLHERRRALWF